MVRAIVDLVRKICLVSDGPEIRIERSLFVMETMEISSELLVTEVRHRVPAKNWQTFTKK